MQIVYFVPKQQSLDEMKRAYQRQMEAKARPGQRVMIDVDGKAYTHQAMSLKRFLQTCPAETYIILSALEDSDASGPEFVELLSKRAGEFVFVRLLDQACELDPQNEASRVILHFIASAGASAKGKKEGTPRPAEFGIKPVDAAVVSKLRAARTAGASYGVIAAQHELSRATVAKYTKDIVVYREKEGAAAKAKAPGQRRFSYKTPPGVLAQSPIEKSVTGFIQGQRKAGTKRSYYFTLKRFFNFVAVEQGAELSYPADISFERTLAFRDHQLESGVPPRTIAHNLAVLKSFVGYCVNTGATLHNPVAIVKRPVVTKAEVETDPFEKGEVDTMLDEIHKEILAARTTRQRQVAHRSYVLIYLLAHVGPRVGGLLGLTMQDVHTVYGSTRLSIYSKSHAENYKVSISDNAAKVLADYVATYLGAGAPGDYIFQAIGRPKNALSQNEVRTLIARIMAKAGILSSGRKLTTHSFRVFWAIMEDKNGTPVEEIRKRLNHASVDQTMAYLKVETGRVIDTWHHEPPDLTGGAALAGRMQ